MADRTIARIRRSAAVAASGLLLGCAPGLAPDIPLAAPVAAVAADEALARMVPDAIAADGLLDVGTDPPYRPMEYFDTDGRLTGLEVQLVMAVSAKLGLQASFTTEAFTALESGVRAGRFELAAGALTVADGSALDTDAVLYLAAGIRLATTVAQPLDLARLCGARVAALEGSAELAWLTDRSRQCAQVGDEPIDVLAGLTQNETVRLLLTRRAEGMVAEAPVVQSVVQSYANELVVAPGTVAPGSFALLVPSDRPGLAEAVAAAIDALIEDGSYELILRSFGVTEGAAQQAAVLPAGAAADGGAMG